MKKQEVMTPSSSRLELFLQDLPRGLISTLIISLLCALAVTYLMHVGDSFGENLLFSTCIGISAMLLIDGGRLLVWGADEPHEAGLLALLAVVAPLSFFIGSFIASSLRGQPTSLLSLTHSQNITGFIVLTLLASVGGTLYFWNRSKSASLKARHAAIEKQAAMAQLQILQAQIEPHMLFNTLATLQTLISHEPLRAQHMLDQLILYLRATLSASRSEQTTLGQEFELIKAYLGLMSLRMGLRLTYALELPEELENIPIAPMLLQPLVENAIRHGLEPKVDGGDCTVRVSQQHETLIISVIDSGLGLESNAAYNKPYSTHLGLANIRSRLDALYGDLAELTLTHNIPEGAIAQITIPMTALRMH